MFMSVWSYSLLRFVCCRLFVAVWLLMQFVSKRGFLFVYVMILIERCGVVLVVCSVWMVLIVPSMLSILL